jgi:bifunctional isochorismate lyase/aryl carrier protein
MPAEDELPASVALWRPDPGRLALLIHDMQQYFVDFFPRGQEPRTSLIANIAALRAEADRVGVPVFYTAQRGGMSRADRGLLYDMWGPGMSANPAHTRIVPELAPRPGDVRLVKWRYSAFVRSTLDEQLRDLGRDQLLICGVYAHVGCVMTACDAFSRDIEAFLVADAVADFNAEHHRSALAYAASRCAVVLFTEQVLGHLRAAGSVLVLDGEPG